MAKSTQITVHQRVGEVAKLLIKGFNREDIVDYSAENWKVGERQVDKYIHQAKILVEKSVTQSIEYDIAKAIRRYEEIFKLTMANGQFKTALTANKELSTLQGLYKNNRMDAFAEDYNSRYRYTDEELEAIIAEDEKGGI